MNRVVADASAMAAVVFQEPGFESTARRLEGAVVFAPDLLRFELANVAATKARWDPAQAPQILAALQEALAESTGIRWRDVDAADVALLSTLTGLSAYDAAYLWLAGWLEADLVTLDRRLSAVAGLDPEVER